MSGRVTTRGRHRLLTRWVVLLLAAVTAGCAPRAAGPAAGAPPAGDGRSLVVDQTPDQRARTLVSLRLLDDHPLLLMTHHGPAAHLPAAARRSATPAAATAVAASSYACTVFVAAGDPTRPVVGRNFDWDHHPALVLLADPPDGYASVSMVDLAYLGYDLATASALVHGGADSDRDALLRAVTLPFDGMNEHGLVIAMAALDGAAPDHRGDRPTVGSAAIMRLVLDRARTVGEAVDIFHRYTVDFTGGPLLHYLVADATGASAVVEFVDGRTRVLPRDRAWQIMVNFPLAGSTVDQRDGDRRYRTGSARLAAADARLDWRAGLELLRTLRQGHTQWSVVYEPTAGVAHVSTGQRYDRVHEFRVPGR